MGDWDGAARHVDEGLALARRMGETVAIADLLLKRASVALGRDDPEAARAALREAAAEAHTDGAHERTMRDVGLDRSEISSVEHEARHRAERSRVRIAA